MQIGKVGERGERTERKKGEVGGELEGEIDRGREGVIKNGVFRGLLVWILTSQLCVCVCVCVCVHALYFSLNVMAVF